MAVKARPGNARCVMVWRGMVRQLRLVKDGQGWARLCMVGQFRCVEVSYGLVRYGEFR